MHRFFLETGRPLRLQNDSFSAQAEAAHQIANVLRLRPGDRIEVLDNAGQVYLVELQQVQRHEVQGRIIEQRPAGGEPRTPITLYQGLLKGEKFEWVLQKCTEVGVSGFVPVLCERSVSRPEESKAKLVRWSRIILEAAEQARRGRIPTLEPVTAFPAACRRVEAENALNLLAWEGEQQRTLLATLRDGPHRQINLFIGPEGGFSQDEVRLAEQHGILPITLGPRILRAETAGLVAAAMVLSELGEME